MASNRAGVWESLEEMPTKRVFATPVQANNKIYVVGGCNVRGTPLDAFEVFDISSGKWSILACMPTKRAQPAVLAIDKRIYCIGGVDLQQNPMSSVEVFDTETETWYSAKKLPYELMGVAAVVRDGEIYVVGGMKLDKCSSSELLRYNPKDDEWYTEDSMSTPRYASGAFSLRDRLYVVGGRDSTNPVKAVEVYDFETKRWRSLADLPSGRVFPMYAATDANIYSVGGLRPMTANKKEQAGFADDCDVFNLDKEEWSSAEVMPTRRGDAAIGALDGKVLVAGGLNVSGVPLNSAEIYDEVSGTWSEVKTIPSAHCSCTYLVHDRKLYIIGGLSRNGPSGCMEALTIS